MRTLHALGLALAVVVATSAPAHAEDTFEQKAQGAVLAKHLDDVVWALTAPCDKGDDLQQRQCRLIRDARAQQLAGATLLVEADPGAFVVGAWNPGPRSLTQQVTACIRCGGVTIDGRTWYVTGSPAKLEGSKISAALLFDTPRPFTDEARAKKWRESVANARTQFVVKVPDKRRWLVGGRDGLLFDVVAWRVIQPCSGEVLLASVSSGPVAPDKATCSAPGGGPPEVVVAELTRDMVRNALKPVVQGARACYAKYQLAGTARLELGIAGDGSVATYMQKGDFKGTPMGQCIDAAVANLAFPPSQRPLTTIGYPIVLP